MCLSDFDRRHNLIYIDGMKMWLLSQGKMVKVISPKHMRDYVINDMKVALEAYGFELQFKDND